MWGRCGEIGPLVYGRWDYKMGQLLWQTAWRFFKNLKRIARWPSNSTLECKSKRTVIKILKINILTSLFIAALFAEAKKGEVSISGWTDKPNTVHPYNGILSSLKKEGNSDPGYSMEESWEHYGHWRIWSQTDKYCRFHLDEVSRVAQLTETESKIGDCPGLRGGETGT